MATDVARLERRHLEERKTDLTLTGRLMEGVSTFARVDCIVNRCTLVLLGLL